MATLKLIQFSGEVPRLQPRLLPESAAQRAENVRLDDGALTPVRRGRLETTIAGVDPIQTIYKHGADWLAWATVVNAAAGPVAADRLYYTGDGAPKMRVGATVYNLAVPFPTVALTAALAGVGSGPITERLYVYTYVTGFGEESEPCPISNGVSWKPGNTVTLSGFAAPPAGRNITLQRIYRSQSSVQSGTDLFFIAERAVSAANYSDAIAVDDFGELLPSRDWNPPPAGLTGLIALPNGMMAAFIGKELCFSEPYHPHAWPEKYRLTTDYSIVALGAYATTVVVTTSGVPYIVSGSAPENMQQEKLELNLPCVNARGLVDLGYAVAYPSTNGLVVVSNGSAAIATGNLMTRNDWRKTSPSSYVAGQFEGRYYASYEYIDDDGTPLQGTFVFDLTGEKPFLLRASRYANACFYDIESAALYMLSDNVIYEWDALGQSNEIMSWRSKQFVLPTPANFGCILVEGKSTLSLEQQAALKSDQQALATANALLFSQGSIGGELNGAELNVYQANGDKLGELLAEAFAVVTVVADGVPIATTSELNKIVRLPSGFKARYWEVEVSGNTEIAQITMATTIRELSQI